MCVQHLVACTQLPLRMTSPMYNSFYPGASHQELLPRTREIFATAGDLAEEGLYLFSNELAGVTDEFTDFVSSLFSSPEDIHGCIPTGITPQALNGLPHLMLLLRRTLYSSGSPRRRPSSYRLET